MNFKKYRSKFLLVFATLTLLFSSVLLTSCQGKKIKNTVFSVDDLAGKTIGVQLGTTGDTLVSDYETDGSGTTVSRYNKGSDAIQALKQGKADAVVIDEQPALAFVKANPDLTILEEEFANEDYAICVAKGNSLTAKLNEAIEVQAVLMELLLWLQMLTSSHTSTMKGVLLLVLTLILHRLLLITSE